MTSARLPQLDGLRCGAVLAVLLSHTAFAGTWGGWLGVDGVRLFFVLSAFLITRILLGERERLDAVASLRSILGRFYARRTLRIFPAYYALLVVLLVVNAPTVRAAWPWYVLYASNWWTALTGAYPAGVGHLWSLAIEEQFYLTWPAVVLLLPKRQMGRVCVALLTLAVVSRAMLAAATGNVGHAMTPTVVTLDAFALGAWLAWRWQRKGPPVPPWVGWLGAVLVAHGWGLAAMSRGFPLLVTTEPLGASLAAVWLVDRAARGFGGWAGAFLTSTPVQAVGRISYGVYLWHYPVVWALRGWRTHGWLLFAVDLGVTLALAAFSWVIIEAPCNRWKDRRATRPAEDRGRVRAAA